MLGVAALTITEIAISFYSFFSVSKMYCSPTALSSPRLRAVGLSIILDTIGRKNFFGRKPLQRAHRPVVGATLVGS